MAGDEVHLRGTLVPLYGANNLLGQLPVVGLFLGGEKEGLVGVTYEVVGKPGSADAARQSAFGAGAGAVAQGVRISGQPPYVPPPNADDGTQLVRQQQSATPTTHHGSSANAFGLDSNAITDAASSDRLEQDVAFAAERKLDHAVRRDVGFADASPCRW